MEFDFTTVFDRTGRDALALDVIPFDGVEPAPGVRRLPMWVADMSFPTAPPVLAAMQKRLEHPSFGYFELNDAYYESICRWQQTRHGVQGLSREHIGYENGVLGGVSAAIQALTGPGEPILLHSPTYIGFTHVLQDLGRKAALSPLRRDEAGVWRMDYEDMDKQLREQNIHMMILCSPHNPCGRVWECGELERALYLAKKYDCTVISDEIWSDLILPGYVHLPTQSVSDDARQRTVALYAPSKTFSLAGLIGSYHIIYNERLRDAVARQGFRSFYNNCNVLSMHALTGAYSPEGAQWVDALCAVLDRNVQYMTDYLTSLQPSAVLMRPQSTYMLFPDLSGWCSAHGIRLQELAHRGIRAGVIWQSGAAFFDENALRINVALPFSLLQEAVKRLKEQVFTEIRETPAIY